MGQQIGSFFKSKYTGQQIENMLDSATNIADQYDAASSYVVGDLVLYNNGLYVCTGSTTGTFDPTKWTATSLFEILNGLASSYTDPNSDGNVVIGVDSTTGEKILRSLTFPGLTNRYYLPFAQYIRTQLANDPANASFDVEIPDAEEAPIHSTKIKGATVAVNQLVTDGGFTDSSNWSASSTATLSVSGGVARATCTTAGQISIKPAASSKTLGNHVYYQRVIARTSTSAHAARLSTVLNGTEPSTTNTTFTELEMIGTRSTDTTGAYPQVIMQNASVGDYIEAKWMVNFDLTARGFSASEYADAATLKAAWLKKYGTPMPLFAPYDEGSIANVNGEYLLHGKNLYNIATAAQGGIDADYGTELPGTVRSRSDYMKVKPSTVYRFKTGNASIYVYFVAHYDANKNFIRSSTQNSANSTMTTPDNAAYTRLVLRKSDNSTIVPSDAPNMYFAEGTADADFEPYYNGGTIDCSTAPLNGFDDTLCDVKDFATGERTTKCGTYTFTGTETWTNYGTGGGKATDIPGLGSKTYGSSVIPNMVSDTGLLPAKRDDIYMGTTAGIAINATGIYVSDNSNLTGKTIVFELATPTTTTETPQPVYTQYGYNCFEPVSGGVQSAEVDTTYYENIAGYIDKKLAEG